MPEEKPETKKAANNEAAPAVETAPAEKKAAAEKPKAKGKKETKPKYDEKLSKRTIRKMARNNLKKKIRDDKEFAKTHFEAKSKRSTANKLSFRRRHVAQK